ncbi:hypothetical protein JG687_00002645 [Phytophthora cactorum]|uniref:Protein kinase domain-containing protein n=1 Tax=Phytophthora cactorum TaxID=29920 RepID=A0A8T1UUU1_9STRA|nr:hypothetical protein JG687_00002645 [Phytophthora cactorum]
MEAKLSDFGISRERLDETMTAGVGSSLWIAPEVILGERYDDRADMFSFGVVLSELGVHTLPYTQIKQQYFYSQGYSISDATLLQMIITGAARQGKKVQTPVRLPLTIAILQSDDNVHTEEIPSDRSSLWNDEVIIAKRIPRDKIKIKKIISQGSINEFLAEGKMVASMEHPRIVSFISVAWDSLSDICVLLELMDGDVA